MNSIQCQHVVIDEALNRAAHVDFNLMRRAWIGCSEELDDPRDRALAVAQSPDRRRGFIEVNRRHLLMTVEKELSLHLGEMKKVSMRRCAMKNGHPSATHTYTPVVGGSEVGGSVVVTGGSEVGGSVVVGGGSEVGGSEVGGSVVVGSEVGGSVVVGGGSVVVVVVPFVPVVVGAGVVVVVPFVAVVVGAGVVVVVPFVAVVVGAGVVVIDSGVVCACAGTMTERKTGVVHDFGSITAEAAPTVAPPTRIFLLSES